MNRPLRSDAHSSHTDDHCPSTVCFHSLSICVRESGCKDGDGGGDAVGSAKVGHVDSIGDGEDLTRPSSAMTLDLSTDIVLCAAACWACNECDSSTADSSWFDRVVSHSNSWSTTDGDLQGLDSLWGSSLSSLVSQALLFLFNVLQFVRHNCSDAPHIVVVIWSSTSTTKIFLGFPRSVSEVAARNLLHQLPQEADFSRHGVVFSKDALKSAHFIDMDGKRRLGVVKLTLEITDGRRCQCCHWRLLLWILKFLPLFISHFRTYIVSNHS